VVLSFGLLESFSSLAMGGCFLFSLDSFFTSSPACFDYVEGILFSFLTFTSLSPSFYSALLTLFSSFFLIDLSFSPFVADSLLDFFPFIFTTSSTVF